MLHAKCVTATFFNIGQNAAARPQLVGGEARMGYLIGNHTWSHPDLTTLSAAAQAAQMDAATAEQQSLVGTSPCAFRPPYGTYNSTTLSLAQQRHLKVWLWSVDTEDWKANGSSSSYWVNRIIRLAETEGGAQLDGGARVPAAGHRGGAVAQGLRPAARCRWREFPGPAGRDLRTPGTQWRWQDNHHGDPRRSPQAHLWFGAGARI